MTVISGSSIEVSIADKGAELQSIKGATGLEYLWQGDPAFWARRSPLLFPTVGGLHEGRYTYRGGDYKLVNHGFAKERDFRLVSSSKDSARFELESDAASLAMYPFPFRLAVSYRTEGSALEVGWEVTNTGTEVLPFSIGAHPAFRAPLLPSEKREDYDLIFEKPEHLRRWFLDKENLRSPESAPLLDGQDRLALGPRLFADGAIVLKDNVSRRMTLKSRVSGRFVELSFPGFPCLGLWSPKDNDNGPCPFVCVEPWHGIMAIQGSSMEITEREEGLKLDAGKTFRSEYTIRIG
jgi:galactose mutarotase-like enzyme